MAQAPSGNVIAIGEARARGRLSRKESADMLAGCRELALTQMARALSGMLDRVEDDLFELAEKALDRESQNMYLDARAQARDKRTAMESAFGRHFVELFDRKCGDQTPVPVAARVGELSLVNEEDLEETLAMSEMSSKLKASCEGELMALSQRMGFLLERPELEDDANPMSPAAICAALKNACNQIEAGQKVRMTLLRQLESYAEGEVQRIYHDMNSHLVERRILPDVRPGVPRAMIAPAPKRAPKKAGVQGAGQGGGQGTAQPGGQAADGDILAALAQLLGPTGPAQGSGSAQQGGLPAGMASWPTAPGSASAQPTVPSSFVSELTRMHREPVSGMEDGALMNVVRRIKAAPQSSTLGTVDAMTIDIIAMLFDNIFEDSHIPSSAKALLGRLQIPTLKVALLDKSFFSSKAHPARRLMDLLAQSAIGVDEGSSRESPALAMIESVVDRVLAEFETDLALFEEMAQRVAAFIELQKSAEGAIVERSARLIEERERDEIAREVAEQEVGRRLESRAGVPPAVREMLNETWVRALVRVHRTEGEGSSAWQGMLLGMEDLLWSVEPKVGADDRKRLITMLPGMLKTLHEGLVRGELDAKGRGAFLGVLVDCHAMAVKAGMRGLAVVAEPPPIVVSQDPSIERAMIPAGGVQVEEIRLRTPRGAAVRNVFTRTGVWTNLQRGTWVEFARESGGASRARLTWISPNKGVYLFTNPSSPNAAVSISPEALAQQLRLGEAKIIDDASLVDRAVDTMLTSLRADAPAPDQG